MYYKLLIVVTNVNSNFYSRCSHKLYVVQEVTKVLTSIFCVRRLQNISVRSHAHVLDFNSGDLHEISSTN